MFSDKVSMCINFELQCMLTQGKFGSTYPMLKRLFCKDTGVIWDQWCHRQVSEAVFDKLSFQQTVLRLEEWNGHRSDGKNRMPP